MTRPAARLPRRARAWATPRAVAHRVAIGVLAFVTALLTARGAYAQRVELTSNVDTDVVELGDTVTFAQQALVHGGPAPSEPRPGPTPGFTLRGVTSGPVHMRTNINGVMDEVNGLVTSWTLRADKLGAFSLGPSQITVAGARRTSPAVRVRVVERGKGPRRGGGRPPAIDPFGASPLDPWKGIFDFGDDERAREPAAPTGDPKLGMDAPRGPVAFLHATLDKTRAVVGEQVTLSVYLYEDPSGRAGQPADVHEATANDFVKRSLLEDEARTISAGTALVGGRLWVVRLVRKSALFPLKTGRLAIDPMSLSLPQARVPLRESEALQVDVTEPPVAGRPAGYAVGDVGDMSLQATVAPRSSARDGAVGVTLELRGTGNLPSALTLPTMPGVEWLEPQQRDKLGPLANDRFGGTRTFAYVARLHQEGAVDLGEVRLPYFDPARNAYAVARATLGIVNVTAGPTRDAGAEAKEEILPGLPAERRALEGRRAERYVSEQPLFWFALFGSPLGCAAALGAHGLFGRLRERRAAASPSPERIARERQREADLACKGDDAAAAMGAVARAVEAEVLARTGVNLRGAASDTVKGELAEAGVGSDAAAAILGVVRACEDARFSPAGSDVAAARDAWSRARDALAALPTTRGKAS